MTPEQKEFLISLTDEELLEAIKQTITSAKTLQQASDRAFNAWHSANMKLGKLPVQPVNSQP